MGNGSIRLGAVRSPETVTVRSSLRGIVLEKQYSIVERLKPGEEFHSALKRVAFEHKLKAGVIVCAVGSLSVASLRMAGASESKTIEGPLEIVSITGTLSDTSMHVHLSVSDSTGKTIGGHLVAGCKVFTTVELVVLDLSNEWVFDRKTDEQTTYLELDPRHLLQRKERI